MSARQRSYIDEFSFFKTENGIEAWYAGDLLALWKNGRWHPAHSSPQRRSKRDLRRGGGLYRDVPGIQQDDFAIYRDHRGRFRVDLVTSMRGNHLTLGKTTGEPTLGAALVLAEREAHNRGFHDSVVFALRQDGGYTQIGNIVRGRFQKGG